VQLCDVLARVAAQLGRRGRSRQSEAKKHHKTTAMAL